MSGESTRDIAVRLDAELRAELRTVHKTTQDTNTKVDSLTRELGEIKALVQQAKGAQWAATKIATLAAGGSALLTWFFAHVPLPRG
jgi:hypothetical protein